MYPDDSTLPIAPDISSASGSRGQAGNFIASERATVPTSLSIQTYGSNVNADVYADVMRTLGSLEDIHTTAAVYFSSVGQRLTIVSKRRFLEKLVGFDKTASADLTALCLAMNLVIQRPQSRTDKMQSLLYAQLKSTINVLEAANFLTLEAVQCRLLCAFYELGHGLLAGAASSVGACSRVARFAGLDQPDAEGPDKDSILQEERRRIWWALVNLDR